MTNTPAASWACGDPEPNRREVRLGVAALAEGLAGPQFGNGYKSGCRFSLMKATSGDSKWR